jgi:Zn-finger nucleic acid-binding protein
MSGEINLFHKCPKCGVVANSAVELDKLFGFRRVDK